jgi:hypothetical protein
MEETRNSDRILVGKYLRDQSMDSTWKTGKRMGYIYCKNGGSTEFLGETFLIICITATQKSQGHIIDN